MNEDFPFETEPYEVDPEAQGMSRTGRWVRRGRNIVVLLDDKAQPGDSKVYEVSAGGIPSRRELIHPRIDFYAQEALYRIFQGDPGAREDAAQMLAAVKTGQLAGIYIVNQGVPAMRAQKMKLGWWQVIPKGEDAILLLDPANMMAGPPLIAFRDSVKSDPSRLDPALRKAWRTFQQKLTGQLAQCSPAQPCGGITIVAYASGYTSPYANEQAEIAAVKGQYWEPSDEDFAAIAQRSSAPLTVSVNSLQLLLDVINSQPPRSIQRLMLVGHSNPTTFSFSGTIRIFVNLRPRFEFAVVNFDSKNAVNKANLVAPSTASYINRNQLSDRFVPGAEIVLLGCKSGSSGGGGPSGATSDVLLDALSNAFKVCVCGFEKEICSILVHQQIRRGSRIVSERIERGWLAYNKKLACRQMLRNRKFYRTVEQLIPDVRSCVGIVASATAS